jgi:glycosyltransferase involved in cell wall biosynthesis
MIAGFGKYGDRFRIVEIPHGDYEPEEDKAHAAKSAAEDSGYYIREGQTPVVTGSPPAAAAVRGPLAVFLLLGYLKLLWIDIRRVWTVRAQCRKSLILTNHFGCETLPIALRIVFPFSRLVAISHTHPGQGGAANHWVRRLVERMCFHSLSDVIFNSDGSRQLWVQKLRVQKEIGQVVHLGTELPDLSIPPDYPVRSEGVVDFLCVARFVGWKGHLNLVRAWRTVLERGLLRVRLIFIGDGDCFEAVKQEVARLGLAQHIILLGYRGNGDCYFNSADVGLLLSTEPEAFGLVLLEAMSRGKPVIASRLGGIPEIVTDGNTGVLVDPMDTTAIADAVGRLACSTDERKRMGENGKKRWVGQFTVKQMIARYENALFPSRFVTEECR